MAKYTDCNQLTLAKPPIFITSSVYMAQKIAALGASTFPAVSSTGKKWDNYEEIADALASQQVVFVGDAPDLLGDVVRPSVVYRREKIKTPEDVAHALDPDYRPEVETKKVKPYIDHETFFAIMHERGISLSWNEIECKLEVIWRPDDDWFSANDHKRSLLQILHDKLRQDYRGVSLDWVEGAMMRFAFQNSYNPVLIMIQSTKWDEVDRLPQVYKLLGLADDDKLSRNLIHLWLKQGIALLHNTQEKSFGGESVLVLIGKQGYGKTTFFEHLAMRPQWFRAGQSINSFDKDNARRALTTWISELGEIETTLKKADSEALKNFITQSVDAYRLPYARTDEENPRHTLLAGTANTDDFLVDATGNRRFWLVPLNRRIPRNELEALDSAQLWAQIYQEVKDTDLNACFRPDEWTTNAINTRNQGHTKNVKGEMELLDVLEAITSSDYDMQELTVTKWKNQNPSLDRFSSQQISIALKKNGYEIVRKRIGAVCLLPVRKYNGGA